MVCHANRTPIYEADEFLAEVYCLADRLKCPALHLRWGHGHRHDALQPLPSPVNPILILLPDPTGIIFPQLVHDEHVLDATI